LSRWSTSSHRALSLGEASLDETIPKLRVGDFSDLNPVLLDGGSYWAEVIAEGGPLEYRVTGHGMAESAQRNIESIMHLTKTSIFQFALFGNSQLTIGGDVITDSYNSNEGAYDPFNPGEEGDIGTNATAYGGITIPGGIIVNGSVVSGPDVDPASVVDANCGSLTITGDPPDFPLPSTMPMPAVELPLGFPVPCPNVTINGGTPLTLPPGEHCFHNMQINGGGVLTSSGPVTVYVTGELYVAGNTTVGVPSAPDNFLMLLTSSRPATLNSGLTGSSAFYGGLYGPNATIEIGGTATIFGSVVAQHIEVPGNAVIHYDEAMGELEGPLGFYKVRVLTWREL
jgi:hypothetical protein